MSEFPEECERSRLAQSSWSLRPIRERLRAVREFRHRLVRQVSELADAALADVGRDPDELVATDLVPTAAVAKWLERRAPAVLAARRVYDRPLWLWGCRDTVYRRPRGIVGIIGTWNYPVYLNAVPILHALAAGNGVLWKPSERATRSAAVLHGLFRQSGFPADLIQMLPADRDAGAQLANAAVDFIHFTGSEAVGRQLASRLGERLVPSTLELSGCDALIVLADGNPVLAAKTAVYAATLNGGRTCMAVRRAFVHRSVFPVFTDTIRSVWMTPPDRSAPPESSRELSAILQDASERGCDIIRYGSDNAPSAAVILNSRGLRGLAANREPVFAPVFVVTPFESREELLAGEAEARSRLTVSLFTANEAAARDLAPRLAAGAVVVNDAIVPTAHPATPFSGRGASGWGSTGGAEGLLEMTVPQVVTIRRGTFRPHTESGKSADIPGGYLRLVHGRGLRERFQGFRQLLAGLRASNA